MTEPDPSGSDTPVGLRPGEFEARSTAYREQLDPEVLEALEMQLYVERWKL